MNKCFRKSNAFCFLWKNFVKLTYTLNRFDEIFFKSEQNYRYSIWAIYGDYKSYICLLLSKISWNHLFTLDWFHEIFLVWQEFYVSNFQWENCDLVFSKISLNQRFTKEITKELIWRNIFGETKFFVFPHCESVSFVLATVP